jgi:hypothetical protein
VKNPRWVGEKKDKSKVTQYTNQQLEDILTEQGRDPTEFRKQADQAARAQAPTLQEGDLPKGPQPTQIMEEASAQGITVPREQFPLLRCPRDEEHAAARSCRRLR